MKIAEVSKKSWRCMALGKIRPSYIKRIARKLVEKYSGVFTSDFDTNKKLVEKYTNVESRKVRNKIAGYVVNLVLRSQYEYVAPEEEEFPEDYEEYEEAREAPEEVEEAEEEEVEEAEEEEKEGEVGKDEEEEVGRE
ncbi:MAG: 30S ribosomal protein S17e [Candidatus Jordarchaeaceae archaeon]